MIKRKGIILVGIQDSDIEIGRSCKNDPLLYINTPIERSIIRTESVIYDSANNVVVLIHPNKKQKIQ
jgi:hypothetical protein